MQPASLPGVVSTELASWPVANDVEFCAFHVLHTQARRVFSRVSRSQLTKAAEHDSFGLRLGLTSAIRCSTWNIRHVDRPLSGSRRGVGRARSARLAARLTVVWRDTGTHCSTWNVAQ